MNIKENFEQIVDYILNFVDKIKGYIDTVIEYFTELRDRIEGFLEYIHDKIQQIDSIVSELQSATAA